MAIALANLACVVLAAGRSQRMGGLDKLAQPLSGESVIARTLETVTRLGLQQVIVVVAEPAGICAQTAKCFGCDVVENPNADGGMGTSIAAGVAKLTPDAQGAFVHLGDMPFVRKETFKSLAQSLSDQDGDCIHVAAPVLDGKRGNPVLFAAALFDDLKALTGNRGARDLIAADPARTTLVAVDDAGIAFDIDTAKDLREAKAMLGSP